jgi:hypothetical protein
MKKLLVALAFVPMFALAQHHHHNHQPSYRYHHVYGWTWSVPIIVGGAIIGYEITRINQPQVIIQQPPPVYIQQQQPMPVTNSCSAWTETMNADGTVTRTRVCQ